MRIRFGEFPPDHYFILITRPFVEWCFKFSSWVVLTSLVRYAYEKTNIPYLLYLRLTLEALLLLFCYGFADWVGNFRRKKPISGKALLDAAESPPPSKWTRRWRFSLQVATAAVIGVSIFLVYSAMNVAVHAVLEAIVEFHRANT